LNTALDGVRVVDLTQYVAGPYCTQVLADLGAEVVKIERPGTGDVYRRQGPVFANGESASFLALNRGKKSIELALDDPALDRLLASADVLVENGRPGWLRRFGLDYDVVRSRHRRLIYCSISAFGSSGPAAQRGGYDLTVQALTGLIAMTGHDDGPPAKIPIAALDFGGGLYAALGIVAALQMRERTGHGQLVATSLFETALAWLSMHVLTLELGGEEPRRLGSRSPFFAPYAVFRTQDGYLALVGTGGNDAWGALCRVLGLEALRNDARFADNAARVANADALHREIELALARAPTNEWVSAFDSAGIACAPVLALGEVLASEQTAATRLIGTLEHPTAGTIPTVGLPLHLSAATTTATLPPPVLGEHNAELKAADANADG
jgi:crotonobetainyl-CoA:carnitine CoA-transferase CaiB-like acyl-CoA transferase